MNVLLQVRASWCLIRTPEASKVSGLVFQDLLKLLDSAEASLTEVHLHVSREFALLQIAEISGQFPELFLPVLAPLLR